MIAHRHLANLFYKPFPNIIWKYPPYENTVYLTFDDGPYPAVTGPVLELLKKEKIPATFFLSGESIDTHRNELSDLDYSPFQLGNHFYRHQPLFGMGEADIAEEANITDQLILQHFKGLAQTFRPPYGVFSPKLFPALQSTGKRMVLWTLMAYDFKWNAVKILNHLRKNVRAGDIIVFHDSPQTKNVMSEVLPAFIDDCRRRGWKFGDIVL